jgi:hypothetical protein
MALQILAAAAAAVPHVMLVDLMAFHSAHRVETAAQAL